MQPCFPRCILKKMSATQLARGLFAFQIPVGLLLVVGATGSLMGPGGSSLGWLLYVAGPLAAALLLGSLVTWGLESRYPLPAKARLRRVARYQIPALVFAHLPMLFYAFMGGIVFRRRFDAEISLTIYGVQLACYVVFVVLPLTFVGLKGMLGRRSPMVPE